MEVFNLDSSKLNEILYNMEDQEQQSIIEITSGEISKKGSLFKAEEDRYYSLPKWTPVEGFRVMNDFVFQLKNPLVKDELTQILKSGHGVFRKFKNCLKNNSEIEKLWFSFKKSEMKIHIINWYNQIREFVGLEHLSEDYIEDDQDLLDFDFTIEPCPKNEYESILTYDKKGFNELYSNYPGDVIEGLYSQKRGDLNSESLDEDYVYISRTPAGEVAGFIWASVFTLGDNFDIMELTQLYVVPEYRGLGISKMLLNSLIDRYKEGFFKEFVINCQNNNSWLIGFLESLGFNISSQELSFRRTLGN